MSDAYAAVDDALFVALNGGIVGAMVYQDVPDNAPYPFVDIGDLDGTKLEAKDDGDWRFTVSILTFVEASERQPLTVIMDQIDTLLDGKALAAGGWTIRPILESATAVRDDEALYSGTSTFTVFAFRD